MDFLMMDKKHLPFPGGCIRSQPPDMIADWRIISNVEAQWHEKNSKDKPGNKHKAR